jgi:hypothetical protein
MFILYETTNIVNGRKYRGMHCCERLDDGYIGSGLAFKRAVKFYGKENFQRAILDVVDTRDEAIELEKFYVNEAWVNDRTTYNLQTGGYYFGSLSEESRRKIADTLKRRRTNGEIISKCTKGRKVSEETIRKIQETMRKKRADPNYVNPRIGVPSPKKGIKTGKSSWNKGMKFGPKSEEWKKQVSEKVKLHIAVHGHNRKGVVSWNLGIPNPGQKKAAEASQYLWTCQHCGKEGKGASNLKRWHGDNCLSHNPNEMIACV